MYYLALLEGILVNIYKTNLDTKFSLKFIYQNKEFTILH